MEEKRKRPTVGQVRALEARIDELQKFIRENSNEALRKKLDEQIEDTSRLVRDCDEWREKYQRLVEKKNVLEQSNSLLNGELLRVRHSNEHLENIVRGRDEYIDRILHRNLWERILNKS